MEKFRVISDLHMDINRDYPLDVEKDDIFTVIAGDTSGYQEIVDIGNDKKYDIKISNVRKFLDNVGKYDGTISLKYHKDSDNWKFKDKTVELNDDCFTIRLKDTINDKSEDGDTVKIRVKNVEKYLRKIVSNGIIIAGNHLVYNNYHKTIEELKDDMHKRYPIDGDISFLDNSVGVMTKEVDGILFIGSTLYTDYVLDTPYTRYGKSSSSEYDREKTVEMNMRLAMPKFSGGGLNDFNFGRTTEGMYKKNAWDYEDGVDNGIYWLTSKNYLNFFNRTFEEIKRIVEENKNKEIVIVTHHCPSTKCIASEYVDDELNASYVSNLDDFIVSHENIKCWCCGHVHHRDSFKVGNCLVVMNPLGYCTGKQYADKDGGNWSFNTFVNTKTWELEKEPFNVDKWNKKYDKEQKRRMKYYSRLGAFIF